MRAIIWFLALGLCGPASAQPSPAAVGAPEMSRLGSPGPAPPGLGQPAVIEQPDGAGPSTLPASQAGAAPVLLPMGGRGQQPAEVEEAARAHDLGRIEGLVTIPDTESGTLVQPAGRVWRDFHSDWLPWAGAVLVLGTLFLLASFYLWRGRIRVAGGLAGRRMARFGVLERTNHWMVASSFIILAISGLNLTFGRWLLRPWMGPEAFTALSQAAKIAHNFLGFPFTVGVLVMFVLWLRGNIPNRTDIAWLRQGGGMVGEHHPPAGRFNAGQKAVFWMTVLGGGAVAASGYVLIFPFALTNIAGQQLAHAVHAAFAMLMIAGILAHIYIGTLGMEGAADAMVAGGVDVNWALQHHSLWAADHLAEVDADRRRSTNLPPDSR